MSYESLPRITMDPGIHIRSTWRDAIGAPLTDSMIRKYAKRGRYGEEFKPITKKALKQQRKEQRQRKQRAIDEFI